MGRPPRSKNKPKPPAAGHNSIDREKLREIVERIEEMEIGRAELAEGVKEILLEAKGLGFDTAAIRKVIKIRKDQAKHDDRQAIVDSYLAAVGDFVTTPLGQAGLAGLDPEPRPF